LKFCEKCGKLKTKNNNWVESKTGHAIFSGSQINTMSKITLPLAIFHIDNVLDYPDSIQMHWDLKSGKE